MDFALFDLRQLDLVVTGAIMSAALVGAILTWHNGPAGLGHYAAYGYIAIVLVVGPVFTARLVGPAGAGILDADTQLMVLAFGHTIAFILVASLLLQTVRRVRR